MKKNIFILFSFILLPSVLFSQSPSTSQNYVMETMVKAPGITALSQLGGLPVADANRTIHYLDGLGRPLQTVQWQGSPLKRDIVQPIVYDAFGREGVKYLPFADIGLADGGLRSTATGTQASYYATGSWDANIVKTSFPYSKTVFEASPLNRVLEQGAPGASWQPAGSRSTTSGRTVVNAYHVNNSNDAVKLWTANSNGAISSGIYAAGKLYKHTSHDENWDGNSDVGMTETFTDLQGRVVLKRVAESVSSKLNTYYIYDDLGNLRYVVPPAVTANSFTEADVNFSNYIYGYHYDPRKRVIEKKIPGKGWEHIVYNKLDQVVLTQDSVQRANNQWFFNKYDVMGRNILSGPLSSSAPRSTWQALIDAQSITSLWEERDNTNLGASGTGYTNRSLPSAGIIVHYTINYFDDYAYFGWGSAYGAIGSVSNRTKGLSTGVKVFVPGAGHYLLTVPYYDQEGRVVETMSNNLLVGTDRVRNTYNFAGELIASTRTHIDGSANQTTIANRFTYDHTGRKLKSYSKIGNTGSTEILLSELSYNEIGQLKQKQLHSEDGGASFKQSTKYAYNERGWLKGSASPQFSMKLGYDTLTNPQFNGNIRTQLWGSSYANRFDYGYDQLNRLTSATSMGISMNESITYDVMGNITSLTRDGITGNYSYSGNKLSSISGGLATGTYVYDGNGNATFDGRTGMTLSYNTLNLPETATKSGTSLTYTYAGDGRKLKKVAIANGTTTTDYVDGIQYTNGVIDFIQTEEGRALNSAGTYSYQYNLTDHLGNVRYSFDIDGGAVRPLQEDDYYAFGLKRTTRVGTNKYLYNGKELQEELGQYDYGARFYDPVIGRWNVVDALAEKFYGLSPYNYTDNNPVNNIDPNGMETYYGHAAENIVRTLQASDARNNDDKKKKKNEESELLDGRNVVVKKGTIVRKMQDHYSVSQVQEGDGGDGLSDVMELGFGFTPIGVGLDFANFVEGKDRSGNKLSWGWRVFGLFPLVSEFKKARGLWKLTDEGAEAIKNHKTWGRLYKGSDGLWWSNDITRHGASRFKVFKETKTGLEWVNNADRYGDFIKNQHKSPTGTFMSWGSLKTIK